MSDPETRAPNVFPAFKYADAPAAIEWLEKAFGLTRRLVVPAPDGGIAHAEMSIGAGGVMLGSLREPSSEDPWADAPFGLYVVVDDIEAHYERAKAAGAEIVAEINDTDFGSRQYSARDPGGVIWCFGTYRPGDEGA
jgi:uncharacterized glyoxalase superfamily protein PhnB